MDTRTPLQTLVRLGKVRWRIERGYRELKTGLGLDHFEGHSYHGWHRHVTLTVLRLDQSGCGGPTLYAILRDLQTLLAVMADACRTCNRPYGLHPTIATALQSPSA